MVSSSVWLSCRCGPRTSGSKNVDHCCGELPTAVEVLTLAPFNTFASGCYLGVVEKRCSVDPHKSEKGLLQILKKGTDGGEQTMFKKQALFYGYRSEDKDLIYLSPYEFEQWWEIKHISILKWNKNFNCMKVKRLGLPLYWWLSPSGASQTDSN